MKIAEYNEMMAYLTRPEPEVLPQPKPQELLDIQEENKIERQQETMDKASPFLMDESLDFIRRENFNIGSDPREDFTKFRTLDEEIETLGKKQGEKFLRYLGIYGDASFYQPELSITEKNTAKDFKGKKQLSEWWKTIPNQKRRNVRQSFKDYENFVGTKPAIRRKLYESLRTDKKFYNEFKKQAAKTSITEIADGGSRTSFNKIKNEFDDIVFKKQKQGGVPTKQVTDDGNKILKELKKNTKDSLAKIINKTKIPIERVNSALGALYRNNKDNDGKFRFGKISSKIQEKLNSLSNISVSNIKSELVKKGQATKEEVQQLIGRPSAVLSKILPKGSVFEHTLPKNVTDKLLENNLIDKKTYDTLYKTGSRTSPFLNDFKAKFDIQQGRLLDKYLQDKDYKSYKKEINKITKTISDKTGGYKIGYVDFKDGKMNIVANAKPLGESLKKFGPETTQKYLALDNIKYTNNLLQNYNNNPNDEAFSSMFNKRTNITPGEKISKEIVEDYKFLEKSYNSAKPFLKSTAKIINFAKNNLNNPVTKALFANPYGRAAGIATTALVVPSALLADESRDDEVLPFINKNEELETQDETQDETSLAGDIGAGAGLTTGAAIGSKATQADPLKGLRRFGKKGAVNLLKLLGTPAGIAAYEAGLIPGLDGGVSDRLKEGDSAEDVFLRSPITYAGLPLATLGQEFLKTKPALQRIMSLGLSPKIVRAGTPVGLGLMGLTSLYDSAKTFQEEFDALSPEQQKKYLEEQEEFGEDVQGAAEGGRIGYSSGSDGTDLAIKESLEAFKRYLEAGGKLGYKDFIALGNEGVSKFFNAGGRVGFADGPNDPSKRKFIKLMGILSLLPYGIGKMIKPAAKVAETAAPVVAEGVKLGFDKFMLLVDKIKKLGKQTDNVTQTEREVGYVYKGKDGNEYELVEDLTTGDVRVTKDKPGFISTADDTIETIEDRSTFVLRRNQADETTKGRKPTDEYDEMKEVPGPDGTFDDVDEISDLSVKEVLDEIN